MAGSTKKVHLLDRGRASVTRFGRVRAKARHLTRRTARLAVGPTHAEIRAFTGISAMRCAMLAALSGPVIQRRRLSARLRRAPSERNSNPHAWHGCNPVSLKTKFVVFPLEMYTCQTEPERSLCQSRRLCHNWLIARKNTHQRPALPEISLSWERSEKLNCKLVTGSGFRAIFRRNKGTLATLACTVHRALGDNHGLLARMSP